MCDPATIIAGTSMAISIGAEVVHDAAQGKASAANKANSLKALNNDLNTINLRKTQETDATSLTIMQADRQARAADAMTRVAAGEAGVAGASVDALLADNQAQLSAIKSTEQKNLDMTLKQLDRSAASADTSAQNRINGAPPPDPFAVGLAIAGHAVDFANTIRKRKPA